MIFFLRHYGYPLLFFTVLAENLGLPLPSYAFVLVAAALAADLHFTLPGILSLTTVAALAGDGLWYVLGRHRGRPILGTLCSVSLSPDSCVSRTENLFTRHGLKSLLVAKFFPGLNTVAPPLAGMLKVPFLRFIIYDLGGIGLWAGSATALGLAFHARVELLVERLAAFGTLSLGILAGLLVGWALIKWIERRRFYRLLERSRISAPDVKELLDRGEDLVIVDLRSELSYQTDGLKIRSALRIPPREFESRYREIPPGRPVVMYCT